MEWENILKILIISAVGLGTSLVLKFSWGVRDEISFAGAILIMALISIFMFSTDIEQKETALANTIGLHIIVVVLLVGVFAVAGIFLFPTTCEYEISFSASPSFNVEGNLAANLKENSTIKYFDNVGVRFDEPVNFSLQKLSGNLDGLSTKLKGQVYCRDLELMILRR